LIQHSFGTNTMERNNSKENSVPKIYENQIKLHQNT
jgi:hypothetical protein